MKVSVANQKADLFEKTKSNIEDVLLTLKDDDLKNTVDLILKKKVEKEFKKTSVELSNKLFVVSSDYSFLSEFKKIEKARVQYISNMTKASDIILRKNESLICAVCGKSLF